jgi:hypothetical protein
LDSSDNGKIINPQKATEMLNSFFSGIAAELLTQNSKTHNSQKVQQKINSCDNTIFVFPVTEDEVECVVKKLKGKFSTGFYEIPENLVKRCIKHIKKPLTNI